ncbi:MAG: VTT domain-containing protein [Paenibacillus sp.]|nr:VTT domain-containing protein [Paenibacillus sp.]
MDFLQAEYVADWLRTWGIGAYLISIALSVVVSVIGIIPSIFLTTANVMVFGWTPGFFVSWIGEILGAAVSFVLYQKGVLKLEEKLLTPKRKQWFKRIQYMSHLRQFSAVLLARVAPFMPSALVTFMCVITDIRFTLYMLATAIGKAPSIFLESVTGYGVSVLDERLVTIILFLLIIIFFVFFRPKKFRSK